MENKEKCVYRARQLAIQYQGTIVGCAHSSFCAAMDALREYEMEFVSPAVQDEVFKAVLGLTGGFANCNEGTCGAVTGASFAVGVALGACNRAPYQHEEAFSMAAAYQINEEITKKFLQKYGSIVCRDITFERWGMAVSSQFPGRSNDFFNMATTSKCGTPQKCVIANAAAFAVDCILEAVEKQDDLSWVWKKFCALPQKE